MPKKSPFHKKYLNYADVFPKESDAKLSKHLNINKQALDLKVDDPSFLTEYQSYLFKSWMVVFACI